MNNSSEHTQPHQVSPEETLYSHDFTYVNTTARIALYDNLRSAPRIIEIEPAETTQYIENLASKIYEQAKMSGGEIPYTVVREVSENFIHARFKEIIVSILDNGNTIRFADQGPGILNKEKAQIPGFSSAIEPMKKYIRGVGSGLPIVKEYLGFSNGRITIEDNLGAGSVVTISLVEQPSDTNTFEQAAKVGRSISTGFSYRPAAQSIIPTLSSRERSFIPFFLAEGPLGVTEIAKLTGTPQSSTYVALKKLEESGILEKTFNQKRALTDFGVEVARSL